MLGGQSAVVAVSILPLLLVLSLLFARVLLRSKTALGGQTREENKGDESAKGGGGKNIISQVTPLIEGIRNEINEVASCYNLPSVRSAIILPKRKDYELYPILLYIDGVNHPITKHLPPQDLLMRLP
jgi:hypothetical protein